MKAGSRRSSILRPRKQSRRESSRPRRDWSSQPLWSRSRREIAHCHRRLKRLDLCIRRLRTSLPHPRTSLLDQTANVLKQRERAASKVHRLQLSRRHPSRRLQCLHLYLHLAGCPYLRLRHLAGFLFRPPVQVLPSPSRSSASPCPRRFSGLSKTRSLSSSCHLLLLERRRSQLRRRQRQRRRGQQKASARRVHPAYLRRSLCKCKCRRCRQLTSGQHWLPPSRSLLTEDPA